MEGDQAPDRHRPAVSSGVRVWRLGFTTEPPQESEQAPHDYCRKCSDVAAVQSSRTSRAVQARETQIIMQSPASRSSWSRTESRWSGTPSRTGVSQVPQVPSWQEDSTPTPASSTTARIDFSGGTDKRDVAVREVHLEGVVADRFGQGLRLEAFDVQRSLGPVRAFLFDGSQEWLRAAAVHLGVGLRLPEKPVQVEESVFVLRPDGDPVPVAGEFVEERHRRPFAAAVDQAPVGSGGFGRPDHRQHGGDADTAGDEQVPGGIDEGKVVPRAADLDQVPGLQGVVDVQRRAAAVGVAQDAEPPGVLVGGITAERVLAGGDAVDDQVDMCSRFPLRQGVTVDLPQGQGGDPFGGQFLGLDPGGGFELAGRQGEPGAAVLDGFQVRGRGVRLADLDVPRRPGRS